MREKGQAVSVSHLGWQVTQALTEMMGKGRYDHVQWCKSAAIRSLSMSAYIPVHRCFCPCRYACVLNQEIEVPRYPGTKQSISPLPQLFVGSYHRPKWHGVLGPGQPALNACGTGVHPPSLCTAIAHLSGRWQGDGAPNPGPQPPVRGPSSSSCVPPTRNGEREKKKDRTPKTP